MRIELIRLDEGLSRSKIVIGRLPVTIGRRVDAGVPLLDSAVSRRHCELALRGGVPVVRDLRSTNGTYINGRRITESLVTPGDRLQLGNTVFLVQYAPDSTPTRTFRSRSAADHRLAPYMNYWEFVANT